MNLSVEQWVEQNWTGILEGLEDFLRIPSVSTDPRYAEDVHDAAGFLLQTLKTFPGFEGELVSLSGHFPLVRGRIETSDSGPVILIYGHYDVQPPDPLDLWETPPFEPRIRNGRIYARGSADDKGQLWILIQAIRYLLETRHPLRVHFLLEGEEEIGSPGLIHYVQKEGRKIPGDVVVISDTAIPSRDVPGITVSLRGIAYFQVDIQGPERDLHSGVYGGSVMNPIHVLVDFLHHVYDVQTGKVLLKGFYDPVRPISEEVRKMLQESAPSVETFRRQTGAEPVAEEGYTFQESRTLRPSFDINGIWGGYTGQGSKTIIPARAHAKFSFRLVPDQRWKEVQRQMEKFVENYPWKGVRAHLHTFHGGDPYMLSLNSPWLKPAREAYEEVFGRMPVLLFEGGSIPVVSELASSAEKDVLLMGFGLPEDRIHSPNESFDLEMLRKGICTIARFLQKVHGTE